MSQPEKAIPQNQADAMPGGVTREVAVEDTTNDVVRYGDAANKAVRVNVVAGGGGGGGTVTQGPAGNPNDPWNMEVTEDGTDLPVKPGDAANKAVRVVLVVDSSGTKACNLAEIDGVETDVGTGVATAGTQRVAVADDSNMNFLNFVGQVQEVIPGAAGPNLGKATAAADVSNGDTGVAAIAAVDDGVTLTLTPKKNAQLLMDADARALKAVPPYLSEHLTPFVANNDSQNTTGAAGPQTKLSACLTANGTVVAATMSIAVIDRFGNASANVLTLTAVDLNVLKGVSVVIPFVAVRVTLTGLTFGTATALSVDITTAP